VPIGARRAHMSLAVRRTSRYRFNVCGSLREVQRGRLLRKNENASSDAP
jgi:hypothetical protein